MEESCKKCADLTDYIRSISSLTGNAICEDCIARLGIVPVDLACDPKISYSELGTVGGFRWIKADGTIGCLKDGETIELD